MVMPILGQIDDYCGGVTIYVNRSNTPLWCKKVSEWSAVQVCMRLFSIRGGRGVLTRFYLIGKGNFEILIY